MYGLVNKSLEGMITVSAGAEAWEAVKRRAGIEHDMFLSNQSYPDDITYKLVGAAVDELGISAPELLESFGRHWVKHTAPEGYAALLDAAGDSLPDFLCNLPQFHDRISLLMPKLKPPSFECTDVTETSLMLHYWSVREGLTHFVIGLVQGLGERFRTPATVEHVSRKGKELDHDVFRVSWTPAHAR